MKLYALYLVKGKQLYKIGDNIKDHLTDKDDFKEKKLLDWGVSFRDIIHEANLVGDMRDGYTDGLGYYHKPKKATELINQSIVIVNGKGTIKGIIEINKNNREELKELQNG
jgi:hypothetical protein